MSDVTVEIQGLSELQRKFRAAGPELAARVLEEALKAGGAVMEDAVRARTPKEPTGELVADLHTEVVIAPDGLSGLALIGFRNQSHVAGWVEFGHREVTHGLLKSERKEVGHVREHPFMRPAFAESRAEAKGTVAKVLESGVKEIK